MRKPSGLNKRFSRRAFVFGGAQAAVLAALIGRLYYLQFIKADEFRSLAEGNRVKLQLIPPPRGTIEDRNGLPMASNRKNFRIVLDPAQVQNVEETLRAVAQIIPIEEEQIKSLATQARRRRYNLLLIKEDLGWDDVAKIEFKTPDLPGISIDTGQVRNYPLVEKAAHLIGYVGAVSENELTDQPLMKLPGFKIGKNGVEELYEDTLRGTAGVKHVEVNVHGVPVQDLSIQPSVPGKTLRLTIDSRLQAFAAERLGEESGAVAVMDVRNGDLLALVSMPGFDPNTFSLGIKTEYWKALNQNPRHPLLNKAISGLYPPGSTFKPVVGLAGLKAGAITPQTRVFCPGYFFLGNHRFNCWKEGGHGSVNLHDAIAQSCDTFFYHTAQRLGIDPIAEMAQTLGLGEGDYTSLSGEKSGVLPTRDWKIKRYRQPWQAGDTINAGIGQGYVLSTPMQLMVMTARIANGGYAVSPRLADEGPVTSMPLGVKPEFISAVQDGMYAVANTPQGTAYAHRIADPAFQIAGKTGTSQVRRIVVRGQNQASIPWEERHHALFIAYAPAETPRYAISVLVEHGGGGAAAAAPVARDILLKLQQLEAEDKKAHPAPAETPAPAA